MTLTVTIITKNAAPTIRATLESIKWADEIIIFDSGSEDDTVTICREFTDKIWETDWPGFGPQKQRALIKSNKKWVLSLDADEVITPALKNEIQQRIAQTAYDGFCIPRHTVFNNQMIRFADGHDAPLRLARRDKAHFTDDLVHERMCVDGSISKLKHSMAHYSVPSISALVEKMNRYTDITAKQRHARGKKGGVFKGLLSAWFMFIKRYVLKLGFLDGRAGLVLCMAHAQGAFYRHVKTYYLK
jgi:glycosyltransferase involved in cell wall biosynthesis